MAAERSFGVMTVASLYALRRLGIVSDQWGGSRSIIDEIWLSPVDREEACRRAAILVDEMAPKVRS